MTRDIDIKSTQRNRVFSFQDFENADRVDRIMMHMLNSDHFTLTDTETEYKKRLLIAYQIQCENYTQISVIRLIKEMIPGINHASIHKLIADSQSLFGRIVERNVLFDKYIQRERILLNIELCKRDGYLLTDEEYREKIRQYKAEQLMSQGGSLQDIVDLSEKEDEEDTLPRNTCISEKNLANIVSLEKLLIEIDKEIDRLTPKKKEKITMPRITFSTDPSVLARRAVHIDQKDEELDQNTDISDQNNQEIAH